MDAFDPLLLTPTASLNRLRIFDAPPSERWDDQGRLAHDLLSRDALVAEITRNAHPLHLDATDPSTMLRRFERCFHSADDRVLQGANAIARRWGERFATLVLVLERGDARHRAARPDWGGPRWEHWASIEQIWMGGGLCAGPFGTAMAAYAQAYLALRGSRCSLHLAPHAAYLPLLGAARSVPRQHTNALVFDFGGSQVKRAIPCFEGETLVELWLLPNMPVAPPSTHGTDALAHVRQFMLDVLEATICETEQHRQPTSIVISMAAYVAHNQMLHGQSGTYMPLSHCSPSIAASLEDGIRERTGRHIDMTLLHDGTAAARTYAGAHNTAVIMLGTALGSGFPPPEGSVRSVAPTLLVEDR
jgi:hypothetical protein